ncbi:MAG: rhamnulokinase family protein [bacterium]
MSSHSHYLAIDLGAESGRVMLGTLWEGRLTLEELHRFANGAVVINGTRRWDLLHLYAQIVEGLKKAGALNLPIRSLSTDSWGVDYVLTKKSEPFLAAPYQYRDERTDGSYERLGEVTREEIFAATGVQFMTINTLCQLHTDLLERPEMLKFADQFLLIGDTINHLLGGDPVAEASLASTTQLYNPAHHDWARSLIARLGLPEAIFPKIVPSGTVIGTLSGELQAETGLGPVKVVASCSHDTGAAIAAVPASNQEGWGYLSSGTWSLLGVESPVPILTEEARQLNFTNEVGYGGTIRLLKNITGLWILQECMRFWRESGQNHTYTDLVNFSLEAPPLTSLINPADPRFLRSGGTTASGGMPARIAEYCGETAQPVPESVGAIARCILESLSLLYRKTLGELEQLTGTPINRLHIVGGGTRNDLLNQCAASATGRRVIAGPIEATAAGNILIQALACGSVSSLTEAREIVARSFPQNTYEPQETPVWESAYKHFISLP